MKRTVRVLHPTSAWGGGHVQTCINLAKGMQAHGIDLVLHLNRSRVEMGALRYRVSVPHILDRLAHPRFETWARRATEKQFLDELGSRDIAWLWPGVSPEIHRAVAARGNPIIMEGINTRMASAARILDNLYLAEGLKPGHRCTPARIAEEEDMLALATHFFSPSPVVDAALVEPGSAFSGRVMKSSYGAWIADAHLHTRQPSRPITFLFAGSVGLRKGAHFLLRAWEAAGINGRLVLCGMVEPAIAAICARQLALPSVEARGYVRDIYAAYSEADVFVMPSFEEGDPQVTYEAAGAGLPILASPAGAGRMGERTHAPFLIDPHDIEGFASALGRVASDAALRAEYAARAIAAAQLFDWMVVGAERAALLSEAFGD